MAPFIPNAIVKIVSIDPGSYKCGFSEIDLDIKNKKLTRIVSDTILVERLHNDTGLFEDSVTPATLRYYKLRNELLRRLLRIMPWYIAYEGPFMDRFHPAAFGSLSSLMTLVHDAVIEYNISTPFCVYQPQVVKKSLNISGKKGKEIVVASIRKVDEIMSVLETDIDTLDDNGVDSIAVGYTFFKENICKEYNTSVPTKKKKKKK